MTETPDREAPGDDLARLLGEHWVAMLDGGCRCGWRWADVVVGENLGPRLLAAYNAHVAEALRAHGVRTEAEHQAEVAVLVERVTAAETDANRAIDRRREESAKVEAAEAERDAALAEVAEARRGALRDAADSPWRPEHAAGHQWLRDRADRIATQPTEGDA